MEGPAGGVARPGSDQERRGIYLTSRPVGRAVAENRRTRYTESTCSFRPTLGPIPLSLLRVRCCGCWRPRPDRDSPTRYRPESHGIIRRSLIPRIPRRPRPALKPICPPRAGTGRRAARTPGMPPRRRRPGTLPHSRTWVRTLTRLPTRTAAESQVACRTISPAGTRNIPGKMAARTPPEGRIGQDESGRRGHAGTASPRVCAPRPRGLPFSGAGARRKDGVGRCADLRTPWSGFPVPWTGEGEPSITLSRGAAGGKGRGPGHGAGGGRVPAETIPSGDRPAETPGCQGVGEGPHDRKPEDNRSSPTGQQSSN